MGVSENLDESALRGGRLCVVGNINRDLKTAPLVASDRLFQDGETSVSSIVETIGGGGANSACIAAALGAEVSFLGKIGADSLGLQLERTLERQGVRPFLKRDPSVRSGTSIALSFNQGHRHFLSSLPNNAALQFEDLDLRALSRAEHLYRADLWFSEPMLFGGNERLFTAARAAGLGISIDLNWDPCWGVASPEVVRRRKQAVRAVLPQVTMVHGNVRELNEFAGSTSLETSLQRLQEWGVGAVVVHLGARGAGFYTRGSWIEEPALPASCQFNTTGTGDALSICMMLLQTHSDVSAKLRLANRIVTEYIQGVRALIPEIA